MNYGELKTIIKGYLHRSDMDTMIPNFVVLAQARLMTDLKHLSLNAAADISVTTGDLTVSLPTGFMHFQRLRAPYAGGYRSLIQQTLEQNSQILDSNAPTGSPKYYALINDSLMELAPTPDEDMTLKCVYRKRLTTFSADADTDTVLTDFPNAYIYATMLEATPYVNNDKRMKIWGTLYDEFIGGMEDANFEARWSDSPRAMTSHNTDTP